VAGAEGGPFARLGAVVAAAVASIFSPIAETLIAIGF
jgi:hypothetical protein